MIIKIAQKAELFEQQKNVIKDVSIALGILVFLIGFLFQYLDSESLFNYSFNGGFGILFFLTAFVCHQKQISPKTAEIMLAFVGSLLLTKLLFSYYAPTLSPFVLIACSLIIVGLSGVFISKLSLALLALPSIGFVLYEQFSPATEFVFDPTSSFTILICSSVVGYFLAWQKIHLINKSLEQEAHKNTVISNLHEGVFLRDSNGIILAMNPVIVQILERSPDQLLGKNLSEANLKVFKADGITPCPKDELPTEVAIRTGQMVKNFPLTLIRKDNSQITIEVTATPIMHQNSPTSVEFVLATFRDITQIKKAQAVIEKQNIQMLANSKLSALGEMASGIAHEINNPLTIILGRTQHLIKSIESGLASTPEILQSLNKISTTGLRIAKIVKSMKSLSRENPKDEYEKANLRSILDDIVTVSNDYIIRNEIEIEVNVASDIELECNAGLLSQVFINLLGNAIDALKDLPRTDAEASSRWIKIETKWVENKIQIHFHDSGPGIPATLKEKIMLPFFTTKEAGKGTGIGLSLCRTIIENHHGTFSIDESFKNTCFAITLPIYQDPANEMKKVA